MGIVGRVIARKLSISQQLEIDEIVVLLEEAQVEEPITQKRDERGDSEVYRRGVADGSTG